MVEGGWGGEHSVWWAAGFIWWWWIVTSAVMATSHHTITCNCNILLLTSCWRRNRSRHIFMARDHHHNCEHHHHFHHLPWLLHFATTDANGMWMWRSALEDEDEGKDRSYIYSDISLNSSKCSNNLEGEAFKLLVRVKESAYDSVLQLPCSETKLGIYDTSSTILRPACHGGTVRG